MKIGDLFIKLGLKKDGFDKGIDNAKAKTNAFGSAITKIGGAIAGVFAINTVVNFGKELISLAGQAEGVRAAFYRISDDAQLDKLRKSVRGTVSDLELMKRSVMASNFGIPIKELGNLFEFASKRAQDTGQSVDYLVDSIVTGIGRKSPLILDNLGISAVQLTKELNGTSTAAASVGEVAAAVGRIAQKSLDETGRLAETTGTKIASLSAKWENFKVQVATSEGFTDAVNKELTVLGDWAEIAFSKNLSGWWKFIGLIDLTGYNTKILADRSRELTQAKKDEVKWQNLLNNAMSESSGGPLEKTISGNQKQIETITTLKEKIKGLRDELELTDITQESRIQTILKEIDVTEKLIDKISTLQKQRESGPTPTALAPKNVFGEGGTVSKNEPGILDQILFSDSGLKDIEMARTIYDQMDDLLRRKEEQTQKAKALNDESLQVYKDFTTELNDIIKSGLQDAVISLAAGLGELAVGAITGKEFGNQVLQVVGNFMQQMGMAFITFSSLFIQFQAAIGSMNGPLALGIGVALVAAGAAISGLAKKGMSGGASSAPAASGYTNFNSSTGASAISDNVVFELEGNKLIGVMKNSERRNSNMR